MNEETEEIIKLAIPLAEFMNKSNAMYKIKITDTCIRIVETTKCDQIKDKAPPVFEEHTKITSIFRDSFETVACEGSKSSFGKASNKLLAFFVDLMKKC